MKSYKPVVTNDVTLFNKIRYHTGTIKNYLSKSQQDKSRWVVTVSLNIIMVAPITVDSGDSLFSLGETTLCT